MLERPGVLRDGGKIGIAVLADSLPRVSEELRWVATISPGRNVGVVERCSCGGSQERARPLHRTIVDPRRLR